MITNIMVETIAIRGSSIGQWARLVRKSLNILVILTIFAPELRLRRGRGGGWAERALLISPTTDYQPYPHPLLACVMWRWLVAL
jgi:hypothetical protein